MQMQIVARADAFRAIPAAKPGEQPTREAVTRITAHGDQSAITFTLPAAEAHDMKLGDIVTVTVSK